MNANDHLTYRRGALALGLSAVLATASAAPADPFVWGADLRLRQIFIGNVGLNDDNPIADRNFQRYRLRAWGTYQPIEQIGLSARLMWEGRHYGQPNADDYPLPGFESWYSGGLLFDTLTLDFKPSASSPLTFKIGRQDIIFGNGWLILDGTPLDGSRTIYLDAARASYTFDAIATTLDLIYIDQSADTGRFPQSLNGETEDQTEQDETGVVLYATNKSLFKDGVVDGYFIYKDNRANDTPRNIRINNGAPFTSPADEGEVYALGARIDAPFGGQWKLRGETVYEWGTRNDEDLSAFGFNGRAGYQIGGPLAQELHLGYEYLSGDDPDSRSTQAFDPLWGRWPQWSELMIYQWPLESRVGEATNLQRLNLGWAAKVHPTTQLTVDYHALWANENSTLVPSQMVNISRDGNFRGHLYTAWLKTKLNKHVSGHLVAEYLQPGDYYASNRRDNSYFVRAELNLTW